MELQKRNLSAYLPAPAVTVRDNSPLIFPLPFQQHVVNVVNMGEATQNIPMASYGFPLEVC